MSADAASLVTRLVALLRQRCPRCLTGKTFSGWITMYAVCPNCGLTFEREEGYWLGALYVNYALGLAVLLPVIGLLLFYDVSEWTVFTVSAIELVVLSPWIVRYSRLVWMYVDHAFSPR
ncbi:MAG TPA: DUF983 domain-containing protein [Candidatus Acidoferrales bacterium]|nr:DUF983 domain-containing protein [Candidatus Acidoferrales bacterium]